MDCDAFANHLTAAAEGEPLGPDAAAHLDSCERCQAELRLAELVEQAVASRGTPDVPAGFTARVLAAVEAQQWRDERIVDLGFNVAVVMGAVLVLAGAAGVLWAFGWLGLDQPTVEAIGVALLPWASRLAAEAQTVGLTALLLTLALGLWWWVEHEGLA